MESPSWLNAREQINEPEFCRAFLTEHPMVSINGTFFTQNGLVSDVGLIRKNIYDSIKPHVTSGLSQKVSSLLEVLRMESRIDEIPLYQDRIFLSNGTYFLDGHFEPGMCYCRNRLNVAYNPNAPTPVAWQSFQNQLMETDDMVTVQEFLGYCLIPSTRGQKMLILIGRGGEGKSRIGRVMAAIFGNSMNTTSLHKVEENGFAKADLEHKLLMIDDDLNLSAMKKTNNVKTIVTAEGKMDMERKNQQSYQSELYVRFICFGNESLTARDDRSDGFYRRQICIRTKERPPDRIDDPFLTEKLVAEKEGIFLWMLEGLQRLIANNYRFTISQNAKDNLNSAIRNSNNMAAFLGSEGYIVLAPDFEASTKDLYDIYRQWCSDNAEDAVSQKSFADFLGRNKDRYGLTPISTTRIGREDRQRCRGYSGICILD